ncbi:hypothetical protein LbFV_ORF4 [Leptopilina boulardi filamentous virus]|uniref:Uncharacterized protein n=1 Tax=Leptopilina boulardi filamentous virus TaxID=552509 RepID=A0A1S5YD56_9VIRU|nr:hypothetical protein LbFV_ORF4 [Leptopilina boulardi filamentous virus]AQQ79924.1 hypothetical protein LbFV_ORF4 [Leptopilina boulardi filamentous virus]
MLIENTDDNVADFTSIQLEVNDYLSLPLNKQRRFIRKNTEHEGWSLLSTIELIKVMFLYITDSKFTIDIMNNFFLKDFNVDFSIIIKNTISTANLVNLEKNHTTLYHLVITNFFRLTRENIIEKLKLNNIDDDVMYTEMNDSKFTLFEQGTYIIQSLDDKANSLSIMLNDEYCQFSVTKNECFTIEFNKDNNIQSQLNIINDNSGKLVIIHFPLMNNLLDHIMNLDESNFIIRPLFYLNYRDMLKKCNNNIAFPLYVPIYKYLHIFIYMHFLLTLQLDCEGIFVQVPINYGKNITNCFVNDYEKLSLLYYPHQEERLCNVYSEFFIYNHIENKVKLEI